MIGEPLTKISEALALARRGDVLLSKIWQKTRSILCNPEYKEDRCPVCDTPFCSTNAASKENLVIALDGKIKALDDLTKAEKLKTGTEIQIKTSKDQLLTAITILVSHFKAMEREFPSEIKHYQTQLRDWSSELPVPDDGGLRSTLQHLESDLSAEITSIEVTRGELSVGKALDTINQLITLNSDLGALEAEMAQRRLIFASIQKIANVVDQSIGKHVDYLLTELRADVNALYRRLQGDDAPNVRLERPPSSRAQKKLRLLVDFMGRSKVPPGGYLSDAQLHSLAAC